MKGWFLVTTILASGGLAAGHADAATAGDGAAGGAEATSLSEIIVTASRREMSLQRTPEAISAYTGADLKKRNVDSVEALGIVNPSLHVSAFQGEAQVYIRGIGYSSVIGGSDPSTAVHGDGVYLSRPAAVLPAFLDVERVEVVRGPQGTLYGRNATGGSLNIISKNPSDRFEYEVGVLAGDYDRYRLTAIFSGPLTDGVSARLAVQRETRRGYTTLVRPSFDPRQAITDDAEDKNDWMGRLTVRFTPSAKITDTVKADYYEADDKAVVWHYFGPGTQTNPVFQALVPISARAQPFSRTIPSDVRHFNTPKLWGLSNRLEWSVGPYKLTALTAYRETRPNNRDDLDASAVFGVDQFRREDQDQFSQEFQLSSPAGERLTYILGAYYFNEHNDIRNEYFLPFTNQLFGLPNTPTCCLLLLNGRTTTRAYAVFGEATFAITERLQLLAGGRYSSETRGGRNFVVFENAPLNIFDNITTFQDTRFHAFTPKVGLNFHASDAVFVYASVSKGFKSGGFNPGSYQNTPFQPEQIWDYEAGLKAQLLDRTLRTNIAAFYYDYTDLQVQDVANNNVVIRNAAAAQVKGLEAEATWLPIADLEVDAAFTWLDAKFTAGALLDPKFPALGVQPLKDRTLPKAPKFKFSLGAQYRAELPDGGSVTVRGDYSWQDRIFYSAFNVPDLSERSYGWLKGRITYEPASRHWSLSAFADNLTNEVVSTNRVYDGDIIGSEVVGNLAPPRTFGVELIIHN